MAVAGAETETRLGPTETKRDQVGADPIEQRPKLLWLIMMASEAEESLAVGDGSLLVCSVCTDRITTITDDLLKQKNHTQYF